MPHDLSHSTANSASSSALSYTNDANESATSTNTNNHHHYHKHSRKVDPKGMADDNEDDDDESMSDSDANHQKKVKRTTNNRLSPSVQQTYSIVHADMIFYCFEILGNHLFNGRHQSDRHHSSASSSSGALVASSITPPALPAEPYPLFVTWFIGAEKRLRGCIGTFSPMDLSHGKSTHLHSIHHSGV